MVAPVPEINVEEIAARLRSVRKNKNERSVLFLGTRMGRLFGNTRLYDNLKPFSLRNFDLLHDDYAKFSECFEILSNLNEKDVFDALIESLKYNADLRKDNILLAELIEESFFDIVISTDMEDGLERALIATRDMKPKQHFHIYAPSFGVTEDGFVENVLQKNIKVPALIKVFGDLKSRRYKTAYDSNIFESEQNFEECLVNLLTSHILVIGYDPVWDRPLGDIFPLHGGSFWYVNEDLPPVDSRLLQSWQNRNKGWDSEKPVSQKNWRLFIRELHRTLIRDNNTSTNVLSSFFSSAADQIVAKEKSKPIFISYSHKDTQYLNELVEHLSLYKREGLIDFWSDKEIEVGADWRKEILRALQGARVAVLLVSPHFLNSEFIQDFELPQLLESARSNGVIILPVLVDYCALGQSKLKNFQLVNPSKSLAGRKKHTRNIIWVDVAERVKNACEHNIGL